MSRTKSHITKTGRKTSRSQNISVTLGSLKSISAFSPFLLEFHLLRRLSSSSSKLPSFAKRNPLDAGIDFILLSQLVLIAIIFFHLSFREWREHIGRGCCCCFVACLSRHKSQGIEKIKNNFNDERERDR